MKLKHTIFRLLVRSRVDWLILLLPVLITIIGIMTIYSATRPVLDIRQPTFYLRQSIWLLIGVAAMIAVSFFDYRALKRFSLPIFLLSVALLLLTLLFGHTGMGAQRWLRIGPIGFQPSELYRVALLIGLSAYLSKQPYPMRGLQAGIAFVVFGGIPFVILYLQPDLGSAVLMLTIVIAMILLRGITRKALLICISITLITAPFVGERLWKHLKEYQRNRLVAFINPEVDPKGIGYQIKQSKITIGSGRLFGKGYLKGTQGPLRFLPEKHTDFIFSVFAEEWGFTGSVFLLLCYAILILRGVETALYSKDEFGFFLASGISIMFLLYLTVNIAMAMGLMPVVGIPLPFFSYGGTALLTNFICIGILNNIRMRRFELFY